MAAYVRDRSWAFVGALVGAVAALWMTRHALGPEVLGGGDVTAHLARADFGIAELVNHGRLDGWMPRFMLGHEEFLFNGPGLTWAVALVRAPTFGALSNAGALKVVALVALAVQPFAVGYCARALALDGRAAAIAGVLSLTATTGFGLGVEGIFANGLLSHQVGAVAFFVAFGALLRAYDAPGRGTVLVAALASGALMITHLISLTILTIMFATALVARLAASASRDRWRGLLGVGTALVAGIAIVGFWSVPFLAHRDLSGPVVTWGTDPFGERVAAVLRGEILFEPLVAKLVMLGWIAGVLLYVTGRRHVMVLIAIPTTYLVVAHVAIHYPGVNEITLQLANRGLAYSGVFALFPVALAIGAAIDAVARRTKDPVRVAAVLEVVTVIAVLFVVVSHGKQELAKPPTEATADFRAAAEQLRTLVPDGARFSTTRDYPDEISRTGVIEPARWLAWASGRDTLNPFNPEVSSAAGNSFVADGPGEGQAVDDWVRALRRLGVTHVVVTKPAVDTALGGSAIAEEVWRSGEIAIYAVTRDDGASPTILVDLDDPGAEVSFTRDGPERLRWDIEATRDSMATLAVAWSPRWHATVDGQDVPITRSPEDLMQVAVPGGTHTVALSYRPDVAGRLGVLVTLLTAALLVAAFVPGLRRRFDRAWFDRARSSVSDRLSAPGGSRGEPG